MIDAKQEALELIRKLPETASTAEIIVALCFKDQIDLGMEDLAQGRIVSHQSVKERLATRRRSGSRSDS
jgi:predicted transcriptional regulator